VHYNKPVSWPVEAVVTFWGRKQRERGGGQIDRENMSIFEREKCGLV